jgi:hypothetical protein
MRMKLLGLMAALLLVAGPLKWRLRLRRLLQKLRW